MRIIRKALGLLIVDIVIIIGIFVLQFRTDSSIIEKIGNLSFTFAQSEDQNQNVLLKNKLNISYNGLNFYCDDQHPAMYMDGSSAAKPVQFVGYEKVDDLSYRLSFENNIGIIFELATAEPTASLAIIGELPSGVSNFAIPYNYSSNMKLQKDEESRAIVDGRKTSWEVSAHSLTSGYFSISSRDFVATYAIHDETQKFTFDSIVELEIANADVFKQNVSNFRSNLIAAYKANNIETNITEQIAVSYIAAQAESGNYVSAVDEIPQSVKKNKQRTYLSAPYMNTLEEMNVSLEKTIKEFERKITDAANANSLDIFTTKNISSFMYIHSNPEIVKKLLQSTAYVDINNLTIAQATGILEVFVELSDLNTEYAKCLVPALENCVEKITSACNYDGNVITISENDTFLSVIQAIETGIALLRYGEATSDITLQKAGYVLVNSYLTESSSFDLRTLANLYPIIAYDNWYYPHFEKIEDINGHLLWAWTSAKSITASTEEQNALSLKIDFPENYIHYVIIKGIPAFKTIYIYNMAFRTDPRFETYNSSGYVYKQNSQTLLLKSRHKSRFENIRFEYDGPVNYSKIVKPAAERVENAVPVEVVKEEPKVTTPAPVEEVEENPVVTETAETEVNEQEETAETTNPDKETTETEVPVETESTVTENAETPAEETPAENPEETSGNKKKKNKRKKNNN